MKETLKIYEAISIISIIIISQIILDFPDNIIGLTGTGSIINIIFLSIIALVFCIIISNIFKNFSNSDIIDISEFVGGKILKFIVSIILIAFLFLSMVIAISNFLSLIKSIYFANCNFFLLFAFFAIPIIITGKRGLYPLKKMASIIFPILALSIIGLLFASGQDFNINNFFPVFGYNMETTFKTGLQNSYIFNFILIYFFLMPVLNKKNDYKKVVFPSLLINTAFIIIAIIGILAFFPTKINPSIANLNSLNMTYLITRKIRISSYISQTDALFIFIWSFSIICYTCLCSFAISYILNKLFSYESKAQTTYPIVSIVLGFCIIVNKTNILEILETQIFKYFSIVLVFIICFILVLLGNFKKRHLKNSKKGTAYEVK